MGTVRRLTKNGAPAFLAVDFFCGAGGTTRGLIDAGGYVIAGIDKDQRCGVTYSENNFNSSVDFANSRFLHYDVFPKDTDYEAGQQLELMDKLDSLIGYYKGKVPKVPLLFAICAPCQPFTSVSRKALSESRKKGREKDRNLLAQAAVYVERYMPEMVLSENVAGIRDPKYGGIWEDFRRHLENLGYATGSKVVCTSKFGIPQFRKRSILVAVRKELVREGYLNDTISGELTVPPSDPGAVMVSVAEAIGHMPSIKAGETHRDIPNHRARTLSDLNLKRMSSAKPGQSNAYLATTSFGDLTLDCHRKVNQRLNNKCFTDVYTRMHPDRPSPTITTKCHSISNGRFGHFDVLQNRGISLREAAILQSFPEDYVFYPTEQIEPIARMIGNAVPPRLAKFFAGYLIAASARH
ncbi:DNA cytosine methyltransferase [Mesorhizobium sp. M0802]|uniref:DNA cytosine methyltransferase n=1 Tax=Mesorhizobium sp. M0802 TaxID=2957001 RepID=UPI00333B7C93